MIDETPGDSGAPNPESTEQQALAPNTTGLTPEKHDQIIAAAWTPPSPADSGRTVRSSGTIESDAGVAAGVPDVPHDNRTITAAGTHLGSIQEILDSGQSKANDGTAKPTDELAKQQAFEKEMQDMKALLDDPEAKLALKTTAQNKRDGVEPDIIIDKDGNAHLNPNRKEHKPGDVITCEVVTDNNHNEIQAIITADAAQKATVRDLLGYFQMQHPGQPVPADWLEVLSNQPDLPPPVTRVVSGGGGGGGGGFRGGDGGGFSGGMGGRQGSISHHVPREVPRGAHVGRSTTLENQLAPQLKDSLDLHKFVDRVVSAVSRNEGKFTSINPNDAGYGISVGIRQWNQKAGELPTLLKAWHDQDPAKFTETFGQYSNKLLDEKWVRNTNFHAQPGLMDGMKRALGDKEFQDVQVQLAREFVVKGIQLGMKHGFKSELGLAEVVDIANQKGFGGAESALRRVGGAGANELETVHRLENAANRPGGHSRLAKLEKMFDPFKKMMDA